MTTNFVAVMALGLFLGMRHATDPDHVIAVTTIVARQRTAGGAAAIGAAWGVGHTLTILLVGGGIILFGWVIPPRLGLSTELSVGVMLIALGIANLAGARPPRLHLPVWPFWVAGAVCEAVCRPLGIEPPIYRRRVDFYTKSRAFDITRARQEIGYAPRVGLREGIRRTLDWYREHGWL